MNAGCAARCLKCLTKYGSFDTELLETIITAHLSNDATK